VLRWDEDRTARPESPENDSLKLIFTTKSEKQFLPPLTSFKMMILRWGLSWGYVNAFFRAIALKSVGPI